MHTSTCVRVHLDRGLRVLCGGKHMEFRRERRGQRVGLPHARGPAVRSIKAMKTSADPRTDTVWAVAARDRW